MENKYDKLKLENQLCFAFYVCSKEIIRKYKELLDPFNLTYTHYITLLALWEEDNVTVKDLGKKLYLDLPLDLNKNECYIDSDVLPDGKRYFLIILRLHFIPHFLIFLK